MFKMDDRFRDGLTGLNMKMFCVISFMILTLKLPDSCHWTEKSMVLPKWALPWMYPMFRLMPISMWRNLP